ncbi:hypothetical protein QQ045_019768 [Rhodiola kirilowii]
MSRNVSRAVSQSNAQAMFNLGYMHEHGEGLPLDLHLAKHEEYSRWRIKIEIETDNGFAEVEDDDCGGGLTLPPHCPIPSILHKDTNITLITLIPKQKEADQVNLFRPISLTGVKAKVISKAMVNRLQSFLGENSVQHMRQLLNEYEVVSGQGVNFAKSEIMTSKNISQILRNCISDSLGVNIVDYHCKYLGLPLQLSRKRSDMFSAIIDKLYGKTQSWKSRTLSIGGKQVLISSVSNAIPRYWLSCFFLPDNIIHKIHSCIDFGGKKLGRINQYTRLKLIQ